MSGAISTDWECRLNSLNLDTNWPVYEKWTQFYKLQLLPVSNTP